jgi:thioredoxin reductase (NADPH)
MTRKSRNTVEGADYDVAIIGAGPAGLAMAIGLQPEGPQCMLLDEKGPGGQVAGSSKIVNVFGVPVGGIPGRELMSLGTDQARFLGAEIRSPFRAVRIFRDPDNGLINVIAANRERIKAGTVVLALGASHRRLNADGVEQFMDRGVLYGPPQYHLPVQWENKTVGIVGGGNSTGQAADFLSQCLGCKVHIFVRGEGLEKDMSRYLLKTVMKAPNITVHAHSSIKQVIGNGDRMKSVMVKTGDTVNEVPLDYLSILIGAEPQTGWLQEDIKLDEKGYILTDRDLPPGVWPESSGRLPFRFETSMPGVFCGGDVHAESPNRMSCAVGEGHAVAVSVYKYIAMTYYGK